MLRLLGTDTDAAGSIGMTLTPFTKKAAIYCLTTVGAIPVGGPGLFAASLILSHAGNIEAAAKVGASAGIFVSWMAALAFATGIAAGISFIASRPEPPDG